MSHWLTPETTGDFEEMCLASGESATLVTTIGSAQAIVQKVAQEAEQILEQLGTSRNINAAAGSRATDSEPSHGFANDEAARFRKLHLPASCIYPKRDNQR